MCTQAIDSSIPRIATPVTLTLNQRRDAQMRTQFKATLLALLLPLSVSSQTTTPKNDSLPTSGFITANGIRLHYLDWGGTGEPVLFISGVGDGARYFDEMARTLTDRFRVLALTRRGYGKSDKPETGYDVPTLTEDVRQFLDAMKLTNVNLIGHSAGGNEMIQFASAYPERTLKLVFLDAAYDRREAPVIFDADPLLDRTPPPTAPSLNQRIEAEFFREMDIYEPSYRKIKAPALSFYATTTTSSKIPSKRTPCLHGSGRFYYANRQ